MDQKASVSELTPGARMRGTKADATDRELWSHELDWWLNCRDADCGYRSSFAAQVAAIERGGAGGQTPLDASGSFVHPYHDGQVGLHKASRGMFARDRRMRVRWQALQPRAQGVHVVHYQRLIPPGARTGDRRQRYPAGVESRLSVFASVALYQAGVKLEKLLAACARGDDEFIKEHRRDAEASIREAHREYLALTDDEAQAWLEQREPVPGVRTVREAPEPLWGALLETKGLRVVK